MNDAIEDRLRAHFADRTAHEPLPGGAADILLDDLRMGRTGRRSRWPGAALVAAAVAVAALAAGLAIANNDDDSGLDMVDAPFTPEAPDPTVATVPPDRTPPTDPAPGVQAGRSVVVSIHGVLGWWDGSRWVQAQTDSAVPVEGVERYKVVGVGFPSTEATGTAVSPGEEFCQPGLRLDVGGLKRDPDDILAHPPIAVTGVEQPLPRRVAELDPGSDGYREVAVDVLDSVGISDTGPEIVQLLRTDLEGDGTDEVLMVIERLTGPEGLFASDGDYSVTALRKMVDGQPVSNVLFQSVAAGDPSAGETPFIEIARLSALADLNGDGQMEVVLHRQYYEGDSTAVLTIDPSGAGQGVLAAGCGV